MAITQTGEPTLRKPLRLWPGVAAVVLQGLTRFGVPVVTPSPSAELAVAGLGGLLVGLAILVWWTFLSRAPWSDRLTGVGLMIVALVAMSFVNHESMGPLWFVSYAIPFLSLAFVAWAVGSRHLADGTRRRAMVATILLACGAWTLVRTDGVTGDGDHHFAWRWAKTAEDRLLAQAGGEPLVLPPAIVATQTEADWPGFRGPNRNGVVPGVRIETDWATSPPVELWRRLVGPGWSSFAVRGDLFYTQEQRGDDEAVACYNLTTGEPVWRHRDAARFFESNAGAGPRGTPALGDGRVYTFGATGILNTLDAGDGSVVWSRNAASDADAKLPGWGFASSPLLVDDIVIVAVGGRLVAYDLATGDPRWFGPDGGEGYSSPHLLTIDGVAQVLLLSGARATSIAPADGTLLWKHPASGSIVQPAQTSDGDLLIGVSPRGMGRFRVAHGPDGWTVEERWVSNRLKPYFNDFVVHEGHAYGFDGRILASIDLRDGARKWKNGRYGSGQLVLLPDQDLLLVVSEQGELVLVAATPDRFTELARFPAIEGKTWNHPVLVGNLLLVRNSKEMAAFRIPNAADPRARSLSSRRRRRG